MWADGGRENVRGQVDVTAPEGVRAFIGELLGAVPDLRFEIVSTTTQDERCAVQWRLTGTFAGPGSLNGLAPTGDPIVIEGFDLLTVRDGLIQSNDAFPDSIALPRQIGMMPPQGSTADQRLTGAFNAKTRLTSRLSARRGRAGGRGRVGRAGPAGALQRVPDRGRRRRDAVRRRRAHDDARGGERRREARGHPPDGARPRTHRPPRWRPRWACPCCATPTRCRTPKAAAAFATGRRAWSGCLRPSARSTA